MMSMPMPITGNGGQLLRKGPLDYGALTLTRAKTRCAKIIEHRNCIPDHFAVSVCCVNFGGDVITRLRVHHRLHLGVFRASGSKGARQAARYTTCAVRCPGRFLFIIIDTMFLIATKLQQLSSRVASSRPSTPTVHVLVLPSQLPLDLRLQLRGLDEALIVSALPDSGLRYHKRYSQNNQVIPDHMNILSSAESHEHVRP